MSLISATVTAFGWAILHSIWQMLVVSLLLWVLLRLTDHHPASIRYGLCVVALVSLPVLFFSTAGLYWDVPAAEISSLTVFTPFSAVVDVAEPVPLPVVSPVEAWGWRIEDAFPVLVSAWGLGVLLMSVLFAGGLLQTHRLRHQGYRPVSNALRSRFSALALEMGIRHPIEVVESLLVSVPTVVGLLRPIILLPPVALTGLTAEQLESVVLHELAHIRHRDLWINLVQGVIEIVLFFHPAVWWVSHRVRAERELACDSRVVASGVSPLVYARALLLLAENCPSLPTLAVAATDGSLRHRIERLIGQPQVPQRNTRGLSALVIVFVLGLLGSQHSMAAEDDLMVLVNRLTEIEVDYPRDRALSEEEKRALLEAKWMELSQQRELIESRLRELESEDPERWGLLVEVRRGQMYEYISEAILPSRSSRHADELEMAWLQRTANITIVQALESYERALVMQGSSSLLVEARRGVARVRSAAKRAQPLPVMDELSIMSTEALRERAESMSASDALAGTVWLMLGERLFDENDAEGALHWYTRALEPLQGEPRYTFAQYKSAWCMYNLGAHDSAIEVATDIIQRTHQQIQTGGSESDRNLLVLHEETMKDLARFYVDAGQLAAGEAAFRNFGALELWNAAVKRLAPSEE